MQSQAPDTSTNPANTDVPSRKRRRWFGNKVIAAILLCGGIGLMLGYYSALKQPYMWQVKAMLLAHVGRESGSARSEIVAAGGTAHIVATPNTESLQTEIQLMKSPALLREVWDDIKAEVLALINRQRAKQGLPPVASETPAESEVAGGSGGLMSMFSQGVNSLFDKLDLAYDVDAEEAVFDAWSQTLIVTQIPRSHMITVMALSPSPLLAKLSLERWLAKYQEKHVEAWSQSGTTALFEKETARLRNEVRDIEAKLTQFRYETRIFDIATTKNALLNQKLSTENAQRQLQARLAKEEATILGLEEQLGTLADTSLQSTSRGTSPIYDYLERQLIAAEEAVARSIIDYEEDSPFIRQAEQMRDEIKEMMKDHDPIRDTTRVIGRDPIYADLDKQLHNSRIQLMAMDAEKRATDENLAEVHDELISLEGIRAEHQKLLDLLEETHMDLSKMLEGSRIARMSNTLDQAQVTNVRVVSPPEIPSEPMLMMGLPHRVAITGIGGGIGILLALGVYLLQIALREAGLIRSKLSAGVAALDAAAGKKTEPSA